MFTLISKLIDYIIPDVSYSVKDNEKNPLDEAVNADAPFLIGAKGNANARSLTGTVTNVFHGHGLIDGEIYFSTADVLANFQLEVGDSVQVKAQQFSNNGGWYAKDITLINQAWENEEKVNEIDLNVLQEKVIVGQVTHVQGSIGKIDNLINFDIKDCKNDFVPMKGDWISAYMQTEKQDDNYVQDEWQCNSGLKCKTALGIRPSRQWEVEGVVTAVKDNHGYVNEEIFFEKSACKNMFWPRKNNPVKVIAIESAVGRNCQWRAISLIPLSSGGTSEKSRSNLMPNLATESKWYFPGQRPKRFQPAVQLPIKLPQYTVPDKVYRAVIEGQELTSTFPCLTEELCFRNYVSRMSTLLYFEEIQLHLDIQEFNLTRVILHQAGEYLALTVPGLAEGRPSLMIGDKIILTSPSDPEGPHYEGFIHEMTSTDVLLKFYPQFHSKYNGEDYNVEFTFGRTPIRRCHQAVSLATQYLTSNVLFPVNVNFQEPQLKLDDPSSWSDNTSHPTRGRHSDLRPSSYFVGHNKTCQYFNKLLNDRQKTAVSMILLGQCRPTPYIIFGPPGTGKTITLVEAILQVYTHIPSSRLIVCTPSNSAADLITERLHQSNIMEPTQMVRLNSHQRSLENIPESILQYCRFGDDLDRISRFRIIVSTCTMAGGMYGLGIKAGHFTHVFVDESGQATEPECLIPIGLISGYHNGQIVLAGDPKQLGPVIMSPFAKMYGLDLSLLERLMNREVYEQDDNSSDEHEGFDPHLVTMLVNNYRSHPAILELPSRMFYYKQLKPMADPNLTYRLVEWKMLPKPGFPVIFHGVRGEDLREINSPSWFNPGEIMQVVQYLQGVLKENIQPEEIGIITPYRKQVEKIRLMINQLGMPEIKIGSVEEFQGQEKQVIILSCVRSNEKLIGADIRHTLGFLSNPKRLNVSITRAISLLIIVGNPYVLAQDCNWRQLILYCKDNGGYNEST